MRMDIKTWLIALSAMSMISMSHVAYAADTNEIINVCQKECAVPESQNDKMIQAQQMLEDLHANETDPDVKHLAIESSFVAIFGSSKDAEAAGDTDGSVIVIGRYPQNPALFNSHAYSILGKNMKYGFLDSGEMLWATSNYNEMNFERLQTVYAAAQGLKQITSDMSDREKTSYIYDYVCDHLEYDHIEADRNLAEAFCEGKGVCNDYTGLFYVFGTYCRLSIKNVSGLLLDTSQYHTWNMVLLDGAWRQVDVTYETNAFLDESAFANRMMIAGDFETIVSKIGQIRVIVR